MGVITRRLTGAAPATTTDITSINTRLNAEDAHSTAGTTNPIRVPSTGTNYSYWATTQLFYSGTATGTINNIEWFTDGGNGLGTGVTLVVSPANITGTATGYVQATGTAGTTGLVLSTGNYSTLTTAPVNAFSYTTGAPLTIGGSVTDPNSQAIGSAVVLQVVVATTAAAGATPQETMTWRYDTTIP